MHAIQTIRSNSFKCQRELNGIKDGKENQCIKWATDGTRKSNIEWSHHVGLIQGLITLINQHRQCHLAIDLNNNTPLESQHHTIVNRGNEYRNVRCAVCLYEKNNLDASSRGNYKVQRSKYQCPHIQCRAHACNNHQLVVHDYFTQGIVLCKYYNEQRIKHTINKELGYLHQAHYLFIIICYYFFKEIFVF